MKYSLVFATVAVASSSFAVTYGPSTVGSIPDNNTTGVSSTIAIGTGIASVQSITLTDISHTWVGDLIITVTAPDGSVVDLMRKLGSGTTGGVGDSSNFNAATITFAVGGADMWALATNGANGDTFDIPSGTYAPFGNLFTGVASTSYSSSSYASFDNQLAGNWTIKVLDTAGADTGAIGSWQIEATPVPEPATMSALALGAVAMLRRRRSNKA